MECFPKFEDFENNYNAGKPQILWTKMVADLETPVSAFIKLTQDAPYSFLLESVEGGAVRGRYSFIGMAPDLIWKAEGNKAWVNRNALTHPDRYEEMKEGTLDAFRVILDESHIDIPENLPPMAAGLFGYMSYDTVRLIERLPDQNPDPIGTPDGIYSRPTIVAVFDGIEDLVTLVTPVRPTKGQTATQAYEGALERLSLSKDRLGQPIPGNARSVLDDMPSLTPQSNMKPEAFKGMVNKAKEYILAGDIFQVVLSQRFEMPFTLPSFSLYRALRRTNPSPFLFFLKFENFSVVGSSPEILVRLRDGEVTIRPIAGTRKRGADAAEDKALAADLLADPKECAEHLMLLDLGRNDVGRVSKIGTVEVTDQFTIEHYSHVMHIVSNVIGQISDEYDGLQALAAGFPAGTVSGAPKVRAMEIIDELESDKRGVYAGCVGYFGANGSMDTCIALRTAVVKDEKIYVQAGAGIVADSDPESEHQECVNKARAVVRAAEEAVRFATDANN